MTDYTPTTEEVRWQFSTDSPSEFMPEQFDRWLAKVKEQAWDEGFREGLDGDRGDPNPYRRGEEQ